MQDRKFVEEGGDGKYVWEKELEILGAVHTS